MDEMDFLIVFDVLAGVILCGVIPHILVALFGSGMFTFTFVDEFSVAHLSGRSMVTIQCQLSCTKAVMSKSDIFPFVDISGQTNG